jgi:hypothetical protein
MKPKFYLDVIALFLFFQLNLPPAQATPVKFTPLTTPVSGITTFNSLYSGVFIDLTGIQSAGGAGLSASNVSGYNVRLLASSGVVDCGIGVEPFTGQTALVYGYTNNGFTNLTALELSSNDGKLFDLQSVGITMDGPSTGVTKNIRLVGYRSGSAVPGAVLMQAVTAASFGGLLVTFNVAANSNFIGVDKFRIETDGTYTISGAIGVDNVNAINFRSTLAVSLSGYTATVQNKNVVLNWQTQNESNNDHFIIEKSNDGINFTETGTVASLNNNSAVTENYRFIDTRPYGGNNFYRLKQVDLDGKERYLGVQKIYVGFINPAIYPNPVTGSSFVLQGALIDGHKQEYTITDISGKKVLSGTVNNQLQQINIPALSKGLYLLQLNNGTSIKFQKE